MSTNRRTQQARKRAARQRAERQARRERAAELFAQGRSQAEVARQLDVSRQSASRWHAGWQAAGTTGLQSRGPTGHRPKVADDQLEGIEQALLEGAFAHGLPAYAPELNPVEFLGANLKGKGAELANFTGDTIAEVADQAQHGINGSATATRWWSGSLPTLGCPSTHEPSP